MAEFTLSKAIANGKKKSSFTGSNIAWALFVLVCFWAGAQMLSVLIHAPGIFEHLMQDHESGRPQVTISLAVSTLFGLVPFLFGCLLAGVAALIVRWRRED